MGVDTLVWDLPFVAERNAIRRLIYSSIPILRCKLRRQGCGLFRTYVIRFCESNSTLMLNWHRLSNQHWCSIHNLYTCTERSVKTMLKCVGAVQACLSAYGDLKTVWLIPLRYQGNKLDLLWMFVNSFPWDCPGNNADLRCPTAVSYAYDAHSLWRLGMLAIFLRR